MDKKMMMIMGVMLAVIAGMGVTIMGKGKKGAAEAPAVRQVAIVEMDEFLVNLSDTTDQHYIKAVLALEVRKDPETDEKIKTDTPKLRDAIITTMGKRHFKELLTAEGKQSLRLSIKSVTNDVLGDDTVSKVYFTSLAMQ